jgi:hypothetical protein
VLSRSAFFETLESCVEESDELLDAVEELDDEDEEEEDGEDRDESAGGCDLFDLDFLVMEIMCDE